MKEQVAAGLRRMRTTPDFLLYCGGEEDLAKEICGSPVIYSALVSNTTSDLDIPWIPLWSAAGDYILERKRFNEGYEALEEEKS